MNEAIRVEALRKSYGERTVLNGLNFCPPRRKRRR